MKVDRVEGMDCLANDRSLVNSTPDQDPITPIKLMN